MTRTFTKNEVRSGALKGVDPMRFDVVIYKDGSATILRWKDED